MKKIFTFIALIAVMSFAVNTWADDLSDFKQERGQLQQRLAQYQQTMSNIQVRLVELNALIRFVEEKEREEAEKESVGGDE